MNDIDPQSLSSIADTFGRRLSVEPVRIECGTYQPPVGLSAAFADLAQRIAERYHDFTVRALSMGLTKEQADAILESESKLSRISGWDNGAHRRLEHYAQYGYLTVRLGEVLTEGELEQQAFGFEIVLNGDMDRAYAKHFAELSRDKQRGLAKAGIELALQTEWPLERAMAAVMPYVEGA